MQTFLEPSLYARHCLKPHVFSFNAQCDPGREVHPDHKRLAQDPTAGKTPPACGPRQFFSPSPEAPCCLESKGRCHDPITLLEFVPLSMA